MSIIALLMNHWILVSIAILISSFILYKTLFYKKNLESHYDRMNYVFVSSIKKPILFLNNNKPLKLVNYKQNLAKKIRKNIINRINNGIYKSLLIDNEQYAIIRISMHEELLVPYDYQEKFNVIFKDVYIKLVKEYENSGYDIETELSGHIINMKIWSKLK